eukprot:TRINITY_DN26624_c0_g1_i1.p1 TRINITY_DN26624_c0_g1~~TRINITY_DN26624_c0_g1_i1.p1  ORF type:complete len:292 (-),score=38.61 TRINITY_DN26624_c0_g1_i1:489-1247(-)
MAPAAVLDQGVPTALIADAVAALRAGSPVAVLDAESREGETDLFFAAASLQPADLRFLRVQAGGELYMAVSHQLSKSFGLPFLGAVLDSRSAEPSFSALPFLSKGVGGMCQGSCSVGISLDLRTSHTGAPDDERSATCRTLAKLYEEVKSQVPPLGTTAAAERLGAVFHTPGHIFLCQEHADGLAARRGHTELSVALAKLAQITPVMVGCVMLCNEGEEFGALSPVKARQWALAKGIPFLTGQDIAEGCANL